MINRLFGLLFLGFVGNALAQTSPATFMRCGDVSFLDELEASGAIYKDQGIRGDALHILKAQGLNAVRLRLFHTPMKLQDRLTDVLQLASRAQDLDLRVVLALHFSDTWADPGNQLKPQAWRGVPYEILRDSVKAYTQEVLSQLQAQGTTPDIVQVGNEITAGFLWNDGRVGGAFDTPTQWIRLADLLTGAIEGVRDVVGDTSAIMIHIDRGGAPEGARWFFDHLFEEGVVIDMIGLSYYPWWHGPLAGFEATLRLLQSRYDIPVFLAETAYPWTLRWFDDRHNIVGLPRHVLPGYPATPQGQANFIRRVVASLEDVSARGVCYWSPDYVAAPQLGSPWENLALFDNNGEVLPAAAALGGQQLTGLQEAERKKEGMMEVFPNPAMQDVRVRFNAPTRECAWLVLYDIWGRMRREVFGGCGEVVVDIPVRELAVGMYLITLRGEHSGVLARDQFVIIR